MKKFHLLLVIGGFCFVVGAATIYLYSNSIFEKFPDLQIVLSNVLLEPAQSTSSYIMMEKDDKIIFSVNVPSYSNLMYYSLTNPKNLL